MKYINVTINGINGVENLYNISFKNWITIYKKTIIKQYGFKIFIKYTYELLRGEND